MLLVLFVFVFPTLHAVCLAAGVYTIEKRLPDGRLLINEVDFSMRSMCLNFTPGDPIVFLEGDPYGDCKNAEILNLRTKDLCSLECPARLLIPDTRKGA